MNTLKISNLLKSTLIVSILTTPFLVLQCEEDENDPVNQAPQIEITNPESNATYIVGDTVHFTCHAIDEEDGELSGTSVTWQSDKDGEIGQGILMESNQLTKNTHTIIATATDAEGATASDTIQVSILDDENPSIQITQPGNDTTIAFSTTISFTCEATDLEDGTLTGDAVHWTSDIDGALGPGTSLQNLTLSAGTHNIKATATDSHGNIDADSVQVTVEANQGPTVTITAPGNDLTFIAGQDITFRCEASDPDDGEITDENISWESSIDGTLGTGNEITLNTLSTGTHSIFAIAKDNFELATKDTITATVVEGPVTLELFAEWMTGSFSSAAQSETSTDPYHYDVRRKAVQIWPDNNDGYWIYLEQAYAEAQNNPYFQRVYHFYEVNDTIKNTIYALNNASNFVGSWETPEDFESITLNDMEERPNCGLTFKINIDHVYGETSGTSCTSSIPGVAYMSSEQWIYASEWHSWDLGYNSNGVIVMGPYSPYIFDKTENFPLN